MKTAKMLAILVLASGLIAPVANADFTFGTPINLGPTINSEYSESGPSISADGLELYFDSNRPDGSDFSDIWVARRETIDAEWTSPVNLGSTVNSLAYDGQPNISADSLELYFHSDANRPGRKGQSDIWVTTRPAKDIPWGEPVNLGEMVNSWDNEWDPSISSDGLVLFFVRGHYSDSASYVDIWMTTRKTKNDPWEESVKLGSPISTEDDDNMPAISVDSLVFFFASDRDCGFGDLDLYMTTRASTSDGWQKPVNLGPTVNTRYADSAPSISASGLTLYFSDYPTPRPSGRGSPDLWKLPIIPIVDFNYDGFVDIDDLIVLIELWDTNESLCDIGPMPWGDGVVDIEDLKVFIDRWE